MQQVVRSETVRPIGGGALAPWGGFFILPLANIYFLPQIILALAEVYNWVGIAIYVLVGAISGAIAGTIVGLLQRLVMPPKGPWTRFWRRAAILGWALGGGIFWLLSWVLHIFPNPSNVPNPFLVIEIIGAFSGAGIGLGQAVAVREPRQVVWWVVISAGAWAVGIAGGVGLLLAVEPSDAPALITAAMLVTLVGATAGLITGLAMNRLIARVAPEV